MTSVIEPDFINVDQLPGIWCPVQWEMTPEERAQEVEAQAVHSLLSTVDVPEAILRLLLHETEIERAFDPPNGYDPAQQGEWDEDMITFQFKRPVKLIRVDRKPGNLYAEYQFKELGYWAFEITPEGMNVSRI